MFLCTIFRNGFVGNHNDDSQKISVAENAQISEVDTSPKTETDEPTQEAVATEIHDDFDYVPSHEDKTDNCTSYTFRTSNLREEHFQKHGIEMGFASAAEYEAAASAVAANPSSLHKLEAEDGDDVYYLESTNEFVIVSTDGYIRTYFSPEDGYAYFERQ